MTTNNEKKWHTVLPSHQAIANVIVQCSGSVMLAHLVLFGSGRKATALSVQLGEAAGDALHPGMQHTVLIIL